MDVSSGATRAGATPATGGLDTGAAGPSGPERPQRQGGSIAAGLIWITSSNILSLAVRPVTMLVMARLLTPADYGVMAVAAMLLEVLRQCKDFGIGQAYIQYRGDDKEMLNVAFWLQLVIGGGSDGDRVGVRGTRRLGLSEARGGAGRTLPRRIVPALSIRRRPAESHAPAARLQGCLLPTARSNVRFDAGVPGPGVVRPWRMGSGDWCRCRCRCHRCRRYGPVRLAPWTSEVPQGSRETYAAFRRACIDPERLHLGQQRHRSDLRCPVPVHHQRGAVPHGISARERPVDHGVRAVQRRRIALVLEGGRQGGNGKNVHTFHPVSCAFEYSSQRLRHRHRRTAHRDRPRTEMDGCRACSDALRASQPVLTVCSV